MDPRNGLEKITTVPSSSHDTNGEEFTEVDALLMVDKTAAIQLLYSKLGMFTNEVKESIAATHQRMAVLEARVGDIERTQTSCVSVLQDEKSSSSSVVTVDITETPRFAQRPSRANGALFSQSESDDNAKKERSHALLKCTPKTCCSVM